MLEGPIHHAIAEGWWAPTAEYLNGNYEMNQSVIGVLNSALSTASKKGFEKGATPDIAGKFSGYTEAWIEDSFSVETIKELMDLVHEGEQNY